MRPVLAVGDDCVSFMTDPHPPAVSFSAPVAFVSPLVAGTLADTVGFAAVFGVAALFGVVALVVLAARVRDPRHVSRLRYAAVATQE